jgi:hypothetical protein
VRAGVVVQHPDPLGVGAELVEVGQTGAERVREVRRRRGRDHALAAERLGQQVRTAVLAAGVDSDPVGDRRELAGQPLEHGRQPPRPVVADQHHRHVLAAARGQRRMAGIGEGHDRSA